MLRCVAGPSPRHRRICGLVLLRSTALLQQDGGRSLPDASGVERSRPWDDHRRLAYEAAHCGLLSADLAAGIRRVKGVLNLGVRLGNWLTAEQGATLWQAPDRERLKGKRDRALLFLLLACGLQRHEMAELAIDHL